MLEVVNNPSLGGYADINNVISETRSGAIETKPHASRNTERGPSKPVYCTCSSQGVRPWDSMYYRGIGQFLASR